MKDFQANQIKHLDHLPKKPSQLDLLDEFILLPVSNLLPPYANKINIAEDCPARLINFLFDLSKIS